jgi:hypothetical protein
MKKRTLEQFVMLFLLSVLIDFIGILSYVIPVLGEIIDVPWAPLSAMFVRHLYPELPSSVALFNFAEEILPGTDFIPTATLCWFYVAYKAYQDRKM